MRLSLSIPNMRDALRGSEAQIAASVQGAMREVTDGLKADLRAQVVGARLGVRLSNSWRGKTFPTSGASIEAATFVYSNAAKIIAAFGNGVTIRSRHGRFLAIPTEFAGLGAGGARVTPSAWEARTGVKLQFVASKGRYWLSAILRLRKGQGAARPATRYAKPGPKAKGADLHAVVMFNLVPQVTLKKRFDITDTANAWAGRIPGLISDNWKA